ncbi:hypothetical protein [Candidatus Nitrosotenuis cloacae]|uniref:hypothetical protein n=1 Tax=Candidatus Nitrosotenuis cloacae TaxID=1603555 RepID=UPI00069BE147|nr:hypothetical protein [Candidatus Nitrosotenuis cloacae]
MKVLFAFLLALIVLPISAEPLSDRTGLKTSFSVPVGGDTFFVETTANFDVRNVSLVDDTLIFAINSSLEKNIGEIQIPNGLTQGVMRFTLDGAEITPKVLQNERIVFVTLEFEGNGTHTLEMSSDFAAPKETPIIEEQPMKEPQNNVLIVLAAVGIVAAGAGATTMAVYLKRKKA